MTYRAGTHHGVTICREGDGHTCGRPGHDCARGHLVAVITNDDWALAERICALLNAETPTRAEGFSRWCVNETGERCDGLEALERRTAIHTPDVDYAHGAEEALAHVRRQLTVWSKLNGCAGQLTEGVVHGMLRVAAAELGVTEHDPSGMEESFIARVNARHHNAAAATIAADPCTCPPPYRSSTAPDPACPVHRGRRARGPKPSNPPGCICDGSGRACPRHGAVL